VALAFSRKLQGKFFAVHLNQLPGHYDSLDTSRMTLLYFALSAMDVLGFIDEYLKNKVWCESVIDWIYAQQVLPVGDSPEAIKRCGFRGGTSMGLPFQASASVQAEFKHDEAHIAMTYTALCVLRMLGDDYSRVNKAAVLGALKYLQRPDGSFSSTVSGTESDMRFVFCACAISTLLLSDFSSDTLPFFSSSSTPPPSPSSVASKADEFLHLERKFPFDLDLTTQFIVLSQSYDGAIGMGPSTEGHGGTTYTAVASLYLMNRLHMLRDMEGLIRWCVLKQGLGFRGRPEKPQDTCYSFWVGATLKMLSCYGMTNYKQNREFNLLCQTSRGGFGKVVGAHPDLLHSYYGVCGLSLMGEPELLPLDVELGLTRRASRNLGLRRTTAAVLASSFCEPLMSVRTATAAPGGGGVSQCPLIDLIAEYALET